MNIKYKLSFLLILFLSFSCDESLLEQDNENQFLFDTYYVDGRQLTAGTNAIYAQFLGADLWGRMMQYFSDMRADEHAAGGSQLEVHNAQLLAGSYDNANYPINAAWRGFYRIIHRANAVIQYGSAIEDIDEGLKKQRLAEAKFLRAYAYFNLTVHWGKVPIYTEIVTSVSEAKAPAEEAEVYQLMETDLTDIQDDLDWVYTGEDAGRANKGAVKLLLARVYMHQGKFLEAKNVLEDIYNDGPYYLVPNYSDNFKEETEYNDESIFEIGFLGSGFDWAPDNNSTTSRGHVMFQDYSPTAWRNAIPSNKLLNSFEHPFHGDAKEDPRLSETVIFVGDAFGAASLDTLKDDMVNGNASQFHGETIKASWYKYSPMYKLNPGGWYVSGINYRAMRYAEVLIKLAECENEVGTQENAVDYLNEIRARTSVDMPPYPTANYPVNNKEQVMRAIMHESLVEFANEKLRVLELARWRKNDMFSTLNPDPVGYIADNPAKALLPYPVEEASRNPNFK